MHEGVTIYPLYVAGKSSVVSLTVQLSSATTFSEASGTVAGGAEEAAEVAAETQLPFIFRLKYRTSFGIIS